MFRRTVLVVAAYRRNGGSAKRTLASCAAAASSKDAAAAVHASTIIQEEEEFRRQNIKDCAYVVTTLVVGTVAAAGIAIEEETRHPNSDYHKFRPMDAAGEVLTCSTMGGVFVGAMSIVGVVSNCKLAYACLSSLPFLWVASGSVKKTLLAPLVQKVYDARHPESSKNGSA